MRSDFLCISVLRVASGLRVKLVSCKSALNPPVVCSTDRSKAVVPVLVLHFVALWFILRGHLLCVFPCVVLFLCLSVLLVLRLPRLGWGGGGGVLVLVLFVRLFGLCLFIFVGFLFLLGFDRASVCDCGTPWTFVLPFFLTHQCYISENTNIKSTNYRDATTSHDKDSTARNNWNAGANENQQLDSGGPDRR